jgi:GT2 family glycosyltransferase
MTAAAPRGSRSSVVVPTLGRSPLLTECLGALAAQAGVHGPPVRIVVSQGGWDAPPEVVAGVDRWIDLPAPLGFAAAVDVGIAASDTPYVAALNDDAVLEPGWLAALEAALDAAPDVAAVQGVNLLDDGSGRSDGWGLGWNRWLQAVQLGRGEPAPASDAPVREVFGVSATAALYRRSALDAVARAPRTGSPGPPPPLPPGLAPPAEVFDSRLVTYYEDADLACRLRRAGYRALSVPAARARHRGSATAGEMGSGRWRLVYGNRYLVLADLLGRGFWRRLPRLAARDLADLARAAGRGDLARCRGVLGGWGRAVRHLPEWARRGPAALGGGGLLAPAEGS